MRAEYTIEWQSNTPTSFTGSARERTACEALPRVARHLATFQIYLSFDYLPCRVNKANPAVMKATDYAQRATFTYFGLGANRILDAVYPTSEADADGKPNHGAYKYTLAFAKGKLPPVNGFWSQTMYDAEYFFVENKLDRYTLSQRNKLKENEDGSVTMYTQNESPGKDKESNWLPAPKEKFVLMMRMYWPKVKSPSSVNGIWVPPAVKKTWSEQRAARRLRSKNGQLQRRHRLVGVLLPVFWLLHQRDTLTKAINDIKQIRRIGRAGFACLPGRRQAFVIPPERGEKCRQSRLSPSQQCIDLP